MHHMDRLALIMWKLAYIITSETSAAQLFVEVTSLSYAMRFTLPPSVFTLSSSKRALFVRVPP